MCLRGRGKEIIELMRVWDRKERARGGRWTVTDRQRRNGT